MRSPASRAGSARPMSWWRGSIPWIGPELKAFLIRVGLVALIVAVAVTAVTMAILGLTILAPILELRQRLAAAGSDLETPTVMRSR